MRIYSNLDEIVALDVDRSQKPVEKRSKSDGKRSNAAQSGSQTNEKGETEGETAKKLFNNIKSKLFSFHSHTKSNELNELIESSEEEEEYTSLHTLFS